MTGGRRRAVALAVAALGAATAAASTPAAQKDDARSGDRPKLVLRAQPSISTSPARVVFTAEVLGGPDDFEDFYCAAVRWEWGDDTSSESNTDCPPYEAGKSSIRRRFTTDHIFRRAGSYRVMFQLKQRSRSVGTAVTNIQVRSGPRDF